VTIEGSKAEGKVTAVLGSLDPQTRRVPIVAELPNGPEVGLLSGSFVRARIVAKDPIDVLRLPSSALRPGAQDEIVVAKDGKARLVRVAFSVAPDGSLYVRKGLEKTDEIVANPSPEVKDGQPIELGAPAKEGPK
jgi:multidrug efflux pump subunit AcrA (membrane-fusion protein)